MRSRGREKGPRARCGGLISSEMASKDVGAKSRPPSNTTWRKRGCCACDLDGAASAGRGWGQCGETMVSSSQGEKVSGRGSGQQPRLRPQTMWDVELKASTRFSNKEVRGGCERLAPGAWRDQAGGEVEVRKWEMLVQTPLVKRFGCEGKARAGWQLCLEGCFKTERLLSRCQEPG